MVEKPKRPPEEWFCNSHNFGGLPPVQGRKDSGRVVILPVPYETSTTYRAGCRQGPAAIIEASTNMELYDEELSFEPCAVGIATARSLEPADDPRTMTNRIETVAAAFLQQGKFLVTLGGEHTVTVGAVRAVNRAHSDLSVLFLDAHADFRDSYHGNTLNHGCVARRVSELCRITQVGIRSLSKEEAVALKQKKIKPFWAHAVRSTHLRGKRGMPVDRIMRGLSEKVYISIDADVFDPSIMPAVGTPEPGGLLWDEVLDLVKAVCENRQVVGLDFVELAPVPGFVHPEFMAARLLYKIIGYLFRK